jgi:hypothetical protein
MGTGFFSAGIKRTGLEVDRSPPSSAEVKYTWRYNFTPPYVFIAWCLIKHRDICTFLLLEGRADELVCSALCISSSATLYMNPLSDVSIVKPNVLFPFLIYCLSRIAWMFNYKLRTPLCNVIYVYEMLWMLHIVEHGLVFRCQPNSNPETQATGLIVTLPINTDAVNTELMRTFKHDICLFVNDVAYKSKR